MSLCINLKLKSVVDSEAKMTDEFVCEEASVKFQAFGSQSISRLSTGKAILTAAPYALGIILKCPETDMFYTVIGVGPTLLVLH